MTPNIAKMLADLCESGLATKRPIEAKVEVVWRGSSILECSICRIRETFWHGKITIGWAIDTRNGNVLCPAHVGTMLPEPEELLPVPQLRPAHNEFALASPRSMAAQLTAERPTADASGKTGAR